MLTLYSPIETTSHLLEKIYFIRPASASCQASSTDRYLLRISFFLADIVAADALRLRNNGDEFP